MGQTVRTLFAGTLSTGNHFVQWDGRNDTGEIVATGTYLFRLENGRQVQVKKLLLMR